MFRAIFLFTTIGIGVRVLEGLHILQGLVATTFLETVG